MRTIVFRANVFFVPWGLVVSFKSITIQKHRRQRQHKGKPVSRIFYVVNTFEEGTRKRSQKFFKTRKSAQSYCNTLKETTRLTPTRTVEMAFDYWLEHKKFTISPQSFDLEKYYRTYIVGPLIKKEQRIDMLGNVPIKDLTKRVIDDWTKKVAHNVGSYSAKRSIFRLKSILKLHEDHFDAQLLNIDSRLSFHRARPRQSMSLENMKLLLDLCFSDKKGPFIVWPFLTGTRVSEQLALQWGCVDLKHKSATIDKSLNRRGIVQRMTKTQSSARIIPLTDRMVEYLRGLKGDKSEKAFVFSGPRRPLHPLHYQSFYKNVWRPFFERHKDCLPYITPHEARHTFISLMQATGIDVATVSKIAGHKNPNVTLSHYSHPSSHIHECAGRFDNLLTG